MRLRHGVVRLLRLRRGSSSVKLESGGAADGEGGGGVMNSWSGGGGDDGLLLLLRLLTGCRHHSSDSGRAGYVGDFEDGDARGDDTLQLRVA